jgi:hypothetical protein
MQIRRVIARSFNCFIGGERLKGSKWRYLPTFPRNIRRTSSVVTPYAK